MNRVNREIVQKLREIFAEFYPEEPHIRRIIYDADIDSSRITFGVDAQSVWHAVLMEAQHVERVEELLRVVGKNYGDTQKFRAICDQYYHSIGKSRDDQTSHHRLATHIDIDKLKFSDRKWECELFRQILHRESLYRGLIIHSNGQSQAGKSILLAMFKRICETTTPPWSTTPKLFDARQFITWQEILDRTVTALGEAYFPNYLQMRSGIGDSRYETEARYSSGSSFAIDSSNTSQVESLPNSGSGDAKSGHHSSPMLEGRLSPDNAIAIKDTRQQLTSAFLRELNSLPEHRQVVWLIDTAEKLEMETRRWVEDIFGEISESNTQRLILVVASKEPLLTFHPAWEMYVHQFPIAYTVDIVEAIYAAVMPNWDQTTRRNLANMTYRIANGDPIRIKQELDNFIKEQWLAYGTS